MKQFRDKIKLIGKTSLLCWSLALMVLLVGLSVKIARAEWREPASAPPNETFYAPLSANGQDQAKEGYLQLDPSYSPTESNSLIFNPQKPLDVRGEGAKISAQNVYSDKLAVDTDTLYASSLDEWVGIGTSTFTSGIKLKVEGGTVRVGTSSSPITVGTAVSGYSGDSVGVDGEAGATGVAGIYGLYTGTGGQAAKGESQNNAGVMGESASGTGIYAATQSAANAAVYARNSSTGWAGYFSGRLGSDADIISRQFLPTALQRSLVPFTSGQTIVTLNTFGTWTASSGNPHLAFDGTYVWAATMGNAETNHKNLFKIRASDGSVIDSFEITAGQTRSGTNAIIFDGKYVWINYYGNLIRFNPVDASFSTVGIPILANDSSLAVSTINGQRYIWVTTDNFTNAGDGIWKINADDLSYDPMYTFVSLFGDDCAYVPPDGSGCQNVYNVMQNAMVFDGQYIWLAAKDGYANGVLTGSIARIWAADPDDAAHPPVYYPIVPANHPRSLAFDGEYLWAGCDDTYPLLRVWAADPNDSRHPMSFFGPSVQRTKKITFDGSYIWTVNHNANMIYRILAGNPSQYATFTFSSPLIGSEDMVFDGTNIWVGQAGMPPALHKIFSGSGAGQTDLNSLLNLNPAQAQIGSMNVSGGGTVGGATTITGDVQAETNQWGGSDTTVNISGGTATCPAGQFMKSVIVGSDNKISGIVCRQL